MTKVKSEIFSPYKKRKLNYLLNKVNDNYK